MTHIACWPITHFRGRSHSSLHQSAAMHGRWMTCLLVVLLQFTSLLAAQAQAPNSSGNGAVSGGSSSSSNSNSPNSGYESNPFSFGLDFAGGHGIEYTLAVLMIIWGTVCLFLGVRLFKVSYWLVVWHMQCTTLHILAPCLIRLTCLLFILLRDCLHVCCSSPYSPLHGSAWAV
jgi:hypothetical protein